MNTTKLWIIVLAGLSFLGCSSGRGKSPDFFLPPATRADSALPEKSKPKPLPSREQAEAGLVKAIIQRFASDVATVRKAKPATVYLSFSSQHLDPDPVFLKRVSVPGVQIKPLSAAPLKDAVKPTRSKNDVFLEIENIEWLDALNVRTTCSWSAADAERRSFTYGILWENKQWLVQ